ncbi:hypothetical protein GDO86_014787 [Hymenochirus boettgeri]|uniref:POU domain protein n=1 Tax=Hymenochirus boettgeri TaxID=247094 RepID=A0A8T2JVB7_9PIPI|nr:hypothetical protein GDO86_014787 [Hymenochirus boettgeri]
MDNQAMSGQSSFPNFNYNPEMVQDAWNYHYLGNFNTSSYLQPYYQVPALKSEYNPELEGTPSGFQGPLVDWNLYPQFQFSGLVNPHVPSGRYESLGGSNVGGQDGSNSEGRSPETPSTLSPIDPSSWPHVSVIQYNPVLSQPRSESDVSEEPQESNHSPALSSESGTSNTEDEDSIKTPVKVLRGGTGKRVGSSPRMDTKVEELTLEDLERFVKELKEKRVSLGYTQGDIGYALGILYGKMFSQTTICRFESLRLTFTNMCRLKPLLERWMEEAEEDNENLQDLIQKAHQEEANRRRKYRTYFDKLVRTKLENYFLSNQKPSPQELVNIAKELELEKTVVRVWFCNRRQKEKSQEWKSKGNDFSNNLNAFGSPSGPFSQMPQDFNAAPLGSPHSPFCPPTFLPPTPTSEMFPHNLSPGMGVLTS